MKVERRDQAARVNPANQKIAEKAPSATDKTTVEQFIDSEMMAVKTKDVADQKTQHAGKRVYNSIRMKPRQRLEIRNSDI